MNDKIELEGLSLSYISFKDLGKQIQKWNNEINWIINNTIDIYNVKL